MDADFNYTLDATDFDPFKGIATDSDRFEGVDVTGKESFLRSVNDCIRALDVVFALPQFVDVPLEISDRLSAVALCLNQLRADHLTYLTATRKEFRLTAFEISKSVGKLTEFLRGLKEQSLALEAMIADESK